MKKDLEYYLSLPYTIELIPEPEGGWFVGIKELPGCMTDADSREEALKEIDQIKREWLEIALEEGIPIAEPKLEEQYSGKFNLRVGRSLHRKLVEAAEREGISLNHFCSEALAETVGKNKSTVKIQAKYHSAREDEKSVTNWPGLSTAMRKILQIAEMEAEAGQVDETLFAGWVEKLQSQIESAFMTGSNRDGLRYMEQLTAFLRQHMDRSPVFEAMVQLLEFQRRLWDDLTQAQQAIARSTPQAQIADRFSDLYSSATTPDVKLRSPSRREMMEERIEVSREFRNLPYRGKDE